MKQKWRTLNDINQEELKKILKYFPKTGNFKWKIKPAKHIKKGTNAGYLHDNGYIYIRINGKRYKSSRLAFLYIKGYFPENYIDHINRIRNDNRWKNLREVTQQCNMRNCNIRSDNKSKINGVIWRKVNKKWISYITINKKYIHIGCFEHKKDAVKARWEAEKEHSFSNYNLNSNAYLWLKKRNLI